MGKMKKKGETGEVAQYITRNRAVKRLQIPLPYFRTLCILKGIYPREPKHRQKVQKGNSAIKTLYYKKDIIFLSHEPIIWKLREHRAFTKKVTKAYRKKDLSKARRLKANEPVYKVDHIVRERYPTFEDALRDLDDPLSMCFLFASLPFVKRMQKEMIDLCKRISIEFMHYVIEAKALRKVFISIKGYYYQADVMGHSVLWVVPHNFTPEVPIDVDMRVMTTFCELYLSMLGFVNFRLFSSLNIKYPPRLNKNVDTKQETHNNVDGSVTLLHERIQALNQPLSRTFIEKDDDEDDDDEIAGGLVDALTLKAAKQNSEDIKKVKKLFVGFKFFLGRETNRESLTFIIRACGGEVSWDTTMFPGATFPESDQTVTHQIADRPNVEKKYLSRYYLQPQWVYDCINATMLLPVQEYFPGVELPAHISPFIVDKNAYVPQQEHRINALKSGINIDKKEEEKEVVIEEDYEIEGTDEEDNNEDSEQEEQDDADIEEEDQTTKNMEVTRGVPVRHNPIGEAILESREEERLRIFMIPKKQRHLYHKLKNDEIRQKKSKRILINKHKQLEEIKSMKNKKSNKQKKNVSTKSPKSTKSTKSTKSVQVESK